MVWRTRNLGTWVKIHARTRGRDAQATSMLQAGHAGSLGHGRGLSLPTASKPQGDRSKKSISMLDAASNCLYICYVLQQSRTQAPTYWICRRRTIGSMHGPNNAMRNDCSFVRWKIQQDNNSSLNLAVPGQLHKQCDTVTNAAPHEAQVGQTSGKSQPPKTVSGQQPLTRMIDQILKSSQVVEPQSASNKSSEGFAKEGISCKNERPGKILAAAADVS